jgi:hypothetical protein
MDAVPVHPRTNLQSIPLAGTQADAAACALLLVEFDSALCLNSHDDFTSYL